MPLAPPATTSALTATDGSLTPGTSARFNILAPTQVVFTTEPTGASKGVAFTTQPVVEVEDAFGDVVTSDSSSTVTLAITPGTGTAGAKLCVHPEPLVEGDERRSELRWLRHRYRRQQLPPYRYRRHVDPREQFPLQRRRAGQSARL